MNKYTKVDGGEMHYLGGAPVEQNDLLPVSKIEALAIPKEPNIERQFCVDKSNKVWGYFDKQINGFEHKVYLSEKAFTKLKNGHLSEDINA